MATPTTPFEAVVFDLGGVVFPSPLDSFRAYERSHGLPHRFLSDVILADMENGAWVRLERGDLTVESFAEEFDAECAALGAVVDSRALMALVGASLEARPEMIAAVRTIHSHGLATAALTNNWAAGGDDSIRKSFTTENPDLADLFDVVVESAVEGVRKPDPRIYLLACDRLGVTPERVVFLDDLGGNLKTARTLGMTTIKVADVGSALDDLAAALGFAVI